ncbi:O-antigen ligase family protein [Psychromonas hadalis]|uniref:O-antigen ligase family protein n=1 Tax=Psychromonas hadalis TaxID=211669 RepID=UPI0003B45D59|nr:O-antigen ligase family protein [Psychromonas hadalis]
MIERQVHPTPSLLFPVLSCAVVCIVISALWSILPHPVIVMTICLLPIAILVVLRFPFLFILLFIIFSFFRIHEVFPLIYNFKIPLLLSLASLGALFWHTLISRQVQVYWRPELSMLSAFFVLVFVGVLLASNRPVAIEYFKIIYWKIIIMTYAVAWLSRCEKDFALACRLITLFGMLVGLVALSNQMNAIGLVEGTRVTIGREFGSVLGDPNDLALVLMFPVAFACSLLFTKNVGWFNKVLAVSSVVVLFLAIIATQSRGGLLGMLSIFAVFGYRKIHSKTLFFTLIVFAAIILFVFAGISERASGGATEAGIDASAMGRLYAWEAAFGMALHNPFSGVGLNNFYANYYYYSSHWDGLNHAVHSTWFGVLAETGFLGLSIFVACIVLLIKSAITSLRRIEAHLSMVTPAVYGAAQAVFAGLIGTIVSATFLTQGFTWPLYILAALVIAIAQWCTTHLPKEIPPPSKKH